MHSFTCVFFFFSLFRFVRFVARILGKYFNNYDRHWIKTRVQAPSEVLQPDLTFHKILHPATMIKLGGCLMNSGMTTHTYTHSAPVCSNLGPLECFNLLLLLLYVLPGVMDVLRQLNVTNSRTHSYIQSGFYELFWSAIW